MNKEHELIEICKRHSFPDPTKIVIAESYIPYIPVDWNRIIVLSESQNLSLSSDDSYVNALRKSVSTEDKIRRLHLAEQFKLPKHCIGIEPWDNGSLKLAVEVALKKSEEKTAVSNAVLWSQADGGKNLNPDENLQDLSTKLWDEILECLAPELIICIGKIADTVINNGKWKGKKINWRHPSPNAISRVSGMFSEHDLFSRYPEVKNGVEQHPEWVDSYRQNKIFYACHAVSMSIQHRATDQ